MAIDESFFIERQGKRMVLYAGLLGEFHDRYEGCERGISTELLQIPNAGNAEVAIAKATVVARDAEGRHYTFEGIGDASPSNVGRNIAPHIIRMAETRAKARALRDAINVGVTSLEEMGDEDGGNGGGPSATPQRSEEHERLLEKIANKYEELPEESKPDKDKLFGYAFSKIGNARATLRDLNKRLEASPKAGASKQSEETEEQSA